jgi:hypothetical protein
VQVYPDAECWGKPININRLFPAADKVILPCLCKTTWVCNNRIDLGQFLFEIQDTDGLIVLPDWIEYFDTADLVPPAKWDDPDGMLGNDVWLEPFEDRWAIIGDLFIVTG